MQRSQGKIMVAACLIIACLLAFRPLVRTKASNETKPAFNPGVCPPFPLCDEAGNIINPAKGINAESPYSPKQTCGTSGCHNYAKITGTNGVRP